MLKSIDLFTGIGGLTLALDGISEPLVYCDKAPECKKALTNLMKKGKLPVCPICEDVTLLDKNWLIRNGVTSTPDLIVAGFPCTSISKMGYRKGFSAKEQSGLFYEILRIIDEIQVPMVFLENVVHILKLEMRSVVDELSIKRNYNLRWCTNSAANMGAPHYRERWFCLAFKDSHNKHVKAIQSFHMKPFNWNIINEPERTMNVTTKIEKQKLHLRLAMLGNSVVPSAVRYALLFLASMNDAIIGGKINIFANLIRGLISGRNVV